MRKYFLFIFFCLLLFPSFGQVPFLSDVMKTAFDKKYRQGYAGISYDYWYYDSCLYSKRVCRYTTSTAADIKVVSVNQVCQYTILTSNIGGYPGHNQFDTSIYQIDENNLSRSRLVRKLLIGDIYKNDTFNLRPVDTLVLSSYAAFRKVFNQFKIRIEQPPSIYVFQSTDRFGSQVLHFWVDRIGIVKVTDQGCWRYSFEVTDRRNKDFEKMFKAITRTIWSKYKDPYWLAETCAIEVDPAHKTSRRWVGPADTILDKDFGYGVVSFSPEEARRSQIYQHTFSYTDLLIAPSAPMPMPEFADKFSTSGNHVSLNRFSTSVSFSLINDPATPGGLQARFSFLRTRDVPNR